MSRLSDAISWSGIDVTLILFAVTRTELAAASFEDVAGTSPRRVRHYEMESPDDRLGDRRVHEYDLTYDELPADLETIIPAWLTAAQKGGADVSWFGFEGSFDFDHLLTPDIAGQVFAVAVGDSVALALDDELRASTGWVEQLEDVRRLVL